MADLEFKYFNVAVHYTVYVQCSHGLAHLPEYLPDHFFAHIAALYFLKESPPIGIFQYHIRYMLLLFIIEVEQFDNIRVVEPFMKCDLILRIFVIDLNKHFFTSFIATRSFVSLFLASLT